MPSKFKEKSKLQSDAKKLTSTKKIYSPKRLQPTKELISDVRKANFISLNNTHDNKITKEISNHVIISPNFVHKKPINKKLISEFSGKPIYLYDAKTFGLISKFTKHRDLIKELKISNNTLIKYKDSGNVFRNKYLISSSESLKYDKFNDLSKEENINNIIYKSDSVGKNDISINKYNIMTLFLSILSKYLNKINS
jgi:hypothetical protein